MYAQRANEVGQSYPTVCGGNVYHTEKQKLVLGGPPAPISVLKSAKCRGNSFSFYTRYERCNMAHAALKSSLGASAENSALYREICAGDKVASLSINRKMTEQLGYVSKHGGTEF